MCGLDQCGMLCGFMHICYNLTWLANLLMTYIIPMTATSTPWLNSPLLYPHDNYIHLMAYHTSPLIYSHDLSHCFSITVTAASTQCCVLSASPIHYPMTFKPLQYLLIATPIPWWLSHHKYLLIITLHLMKDTYSCAVSHDSHGNPCCIPWPPHPPRLHLMATTLLLYSKTATYSSPQLDLRILADI